MQTPPRSAERDAAILAMLTHVPAEGWAQAARRVGAEALFPDGSIEMVDTFCDLTDRHMEDEAVALNLPELRVHQRVRALVVLRLRINRPHKEATRRALAVLALPGNTRRASCITGRTVDAIWRVAGDQAEGFSWYSKRAILAGVYGSTMMAWMRDGSADDAETLAFLDRRLANVAQIGKARKKVEEVFARFRA